MKRITSAPLTFWLGIFDFLAGYRMEMPVTEVMVFHSFLYGETGYYVCPRCHVTMEREFMAYCDRCEQRLGWKGYKKAKIIYPGNRKEVHT